MAIAKDFKFFTLKYNRWDDKLSLTCVSSWSRDQFLLCDDMLVRCRRRDVCLPDCA